MANPVPVPAVGAIAVSPPVVTGAWRGRQIELMADNRNQTLVFFIAFAAYLLTIYPGIGWEDSAEMVVAGRLLSPMHPPGTPLPVLFSNLAQWLPIGAAAIRVHLLQAFLGAALVAGVYAQALRRSGNAAGWTAAAAVGALIQPIVVRAEVYLFALICLLLMVVLVAGWWLSGRRARCSDHALAGLMLGLGLSSSALLLPFVLVPILVAVADRKNRIKAARMWLLGLALGLAPYLLLPFRDANQPLCAPPDLSSLSGLWAHLSGTAFRDQALAGAYTPSGRSWLLPLAVLVPPGLLWLAARKDRAAPVWLTVAWLNIPWLLVPGSRLRAYFFLPAFVAAVMLAVLALRQRLHVRRPPVRLSRRATAVALVLLLALTVLAPPFASQRAYGPQSLLDRLIAPLRSGDTVISGEIDVTFLLWYASAVENRLAGVELEPLAFQKKSDLWRRLKDAPPGERTWFDFDLIGYAERRGRDAAWMDALRPAGLLLRPHAESEWRFDASEERRWLAQTEPWLSPLGRRQLAYRYLNLGRFVSEKDSEAAQLYTVLGNHLRAEAD